MSVGIVIFALKSLISSFLLSGSSGLIGIEMSALRNSMEFNDCFFLNNLIGFISRVMLSMDANRGWPFSLE